MQQQHTLQRLRQEAPCAASGGTLRCVRRHLALGQEAPCAASGGTLRCVRRHLALGQAGMGTGMDSEAMHSAARAHAVCWHEALGQALCAGSGRPQHMMHTVAAPRGQALCAGSGRPQHMMHTVAAPRGQALCPGSGRPQHMMHTVAAPRGQALCPGSGRPRHMMHTVAAGAVGADALSAHPAAGSTHLATADNDV